LHKTEHALTVEIPKTEVEQYVCPAFDSQHAASRILPKPIKFMIFRMFCAFLSAVSLAAISAPSQAQNGMLTALREEARSFEHGEGVSKDIDRAVRLYCELARAGDQEAQYSLGWIHANGRGIPKNDPLASFFFTLAAAQGHVQAQRMLRYVGEPTSTPPACMEEPKVAAVPVQAQDEEVGLVAATPAQLKVLELINKLAPQYGVNPRLAFAVVRAESNFDPTAVSPKNAQGLMQLIPETSARFNVTKPFDPEQNIRGGLSYLRWLLAYFRGKVPLVVAAYNAGEGAVNRFKGVPPFAETQGYVKRIAQIFKQEDHPYDERITPPSPDLPKIRLNKPM
jgi:hypothetical protein